MVCGRGVARIGDPGMLVSVRGSGDSRRMDRDEIVLGRAAAPDAACCIWRPSAATGPSGPGTGEGAAEPRAAAAARRIWARTWVACRSVRKATCCRRKSTVTWKRVALRCVGGGSSRGRGKGYLHLVPWFPSESQGFSGRRRREARRAHSQSISVLVTSETMFQRASSLDESQFTWQWRVSRATAQDRGVASRARQVPEADLRSLPGGRGAV